MAEDNFNDDFEEEVDFEPEPEFDDLEDDFDSGSSEESKRSFNLIGFLTVLLLVGAAAVVCLLVFILVTPDNFIANLLGLETRPTPTLLAPAAAPPTFTATPVPSETPDFDLPPTHTPAPIQSTATPAPINTLRPTLTPSITPTFPPPTPTKTPTPTPTDTPTPGPTPTGTSTRSAFPFTKDDVSPQYLQNYANAAGCNWMGVAGEVFDLQGNPVPPGQYRVHVWDSGIDGRVTVGDAPAYGPSGWEQFLFDAPRVQDQNVQLETANGTAVSQVYRIQTRASCNQNLVYIIFVQNH